MNNLKKRCLTLLLSLAMIVTYMPTSLIAYAEAEGESDQVQVEQQVDADEPAEEVASEETAPEEVKTEDVKSEEAASEEKAKDAAPSEEKSSEDTAKPADEKTKEDADAKAEDEAKDEFSEGNLTAEEGPYEVTLSYGEKAKIPEGAKLKLTVFDENDKEFTEAKEALVSDKEGNSVFSQTTEEEQKDLGMAAFDLTIVDKDGKEIEPEDEVAVSFKLKELPEGVDAETLAASMEIQHLNESSGDVAVEKIATVDSQEARKDDAVGEIAIDGNKETAEVETVVSAFSTFTITWRGGSYYDPARTVTVHYVDESGKELDVSNTGDGVFGNLTASSTSPAFLIYDIDGYEYSYTYRNTNTDANRIRPILQKNSSNYWRYTTSTSRDNVNWTEFNNGDEVYVVYSKKADPTTGGTPVIEDLHSEDWPQGPASPQFYKSSTNNGNGSNTVSLSITGGEKEYTQSTKANVIVVFDRSGSMGGDNIWRLNTAKAAVNSMAKTLLDGDIEGVKMALVSFSTTASTVQEFTDSYNDYIRTVNGLTADGGTNWEQALSVANRMAVDSDAATFVVFVTDGDPTFRVSRGDLTNGDLDMYDSYTYRYYRTNGVFGEGGDDSHGRNFSFAADEVSSILANNKTFYAIGVSSDVTKVQNLVDEAGGGTAYLATDADALEEAFENITKSIKTTLGFGDVEITDGITELANVEMKVMQEVDPDSFTYFKNTSSGQVAWDPTSEGAGLASYDPTTGSVIWNMGEGFQLEDGVTYTVQFKAWPSQDAYDLVAQLNNGEKVYAEGQPKSITAEERSQIVELRAPTATTQGSYTLKTNTDSVHATYSQTSTTGETVTVSGDTGLTATYHEGTMQNMGLTSQLLTIRKEFDQSLDPRDVDSVTLKLQRMINDGEHTMADFNVPGTNSPEIVLGKDNNWEYSFYVAPGFILDGETLEPGYKFTVTEPDLGQHTVRYDLIPEIVNPMVVNGTLQLIGDGDGNQALTAINRTRSAVEIHKTLYDVDGKTKIYPDTEFTITGHLLGPDGKPFTSQETAAPVAYYMYDKDGNATTGRMHFPTTADISFKLKPGEFIRFVNVLEGCTFEFQESASMPDNYELDSLAALGRQRAETDPAYTYSIELTDAEAHLVEGTTKISTTEEGIIGNTNYKLDFFNKRVIPLPNVDLVKVDQEDETKKLNKAEFVLHKDSPTGEMVNLDGNGKEIHIVTGNKEGSTGPDGWYNIGHLPAGTYYMVETTEPAGYVHNETPVIINVTQNEDGKAYNVTATQDGKSVITGPTDGVYTITVDNKRSKTEVEGTKTWSDDNAAGVTKIIVALMIRGADGVLQAAKDAAGKDITAEVTAANGWKYKFADLNKYAADGVTEIAYEVVETQILKGNEDITGSYTATGGTKDKETGKYDLNNTPNKGSLEIVKTYDGIDNLPSNFGIDVTYVKYDAAKKADGSATTTELPLTAETATVSGKTLTWTIPDVRYGTTVTATEKNYTVDGYAVAATGSVEGATGSVTAPTAEITMPNNNGAKITFNNKYSNAVLDTKVKFFKKNVSAANTISPATFNFSAVEVTDATGNTVKPDGWNATGSAVYDKGEDGYKNVDFGTITYTEAGTYYYKVTETSLPSGWKSVPDSDEGKTAIVTVEVTGNATDGFETNVTDGTITNAYGVSSTTASFPVKKIMSVPAGMTGPATWSYDVKVEAQEGAPAAEVMTGKVTKTADTVNFGPITYSAPGTYKCKVTENGEVAGVTNDSEATSGKIVTVTVVDNGDGTLTATADYTSDKPLTFTNTYKVGTTTASFPVKKILSVPEGMTGPADWSYDVKVEAQEGAPAAEVMTGKVTKAADTATFGPITYSAPGTYTYKVTENGTVAGVTNDAAATTGKVVTVKVVDNKDGTLTATADYTTDKPLTFTNTYSVNKTTLQSFPVKKIMSVPEGLTGPADWSYDVKVEAQEGAPAAEVMTGKVTKTADTVNFGPFEYSAPGTYTYKVTESGEVAGVTNDAAATTGKVVTVKVVDNKDGTLTATADYTTDKPLTFTNTYKVGTTTASFPVKKILSVPEGMAGPADWSYDVKVEAQEGAPAAEVMTGKVTKAVDTVSFGPITYTAPGTYTYKVTESGEVAGVINDAEATTGKTVTVKVVDNKDGTLTATADYTTDKPLTFTNNYSVGATTASFPVKKILSVPEGMTGPADWSYDVKVEAQKGAPVAEVMTGKVTKAVDTVSFGPITYTAPGTYTYKVTESGEVAGVTNDAAATTGKVVTVKVVDNKDGTLTATADYTTDKPLTFTNTYSVNKTTLQSFPVKKIMSVPEGLTGPADWSYDVKVESQGGAPAAEVMTGKVTKSADTANFGPFEYSAPGTYTYKVTESGEVAGVTNDAAAATGKVVTVTVVDNKDGTLTATADYTTDKPLTFTNTYSVNKTILQSFPVKKILSVPAGMEGPADWSYDVKVEAQKGAPAAEVMTGKVTKAADTASFGPFEYSAPGTYTYKVSETGKIAGVTNDPQAAGKTVTVTVVDNKDGTLTATVDYTTDKPLTFTNTYGVVPGEFDTKVMLSKTVEKMPPKTESVTFDFTLEAGTNTAKADKEGETVATPVPVKDGKDNTAGSATFTKAGSQNIDFGTITFTKPGTYNYTITEDVSKLDGGWTTTNNPASVAVVVTDNGDGSLTAEAVTKTITNTFETTTVDGTKTWNDAKYFDKDGKPVNGYERPSVTINLLADGKQIDSKTVTANDKWAYSFTDLPKYKAHGTPIVYTVEEVQPEGFTTPVVTDYNVENTPVPDVEVLNPTSFEILKIDSVTRGAIGTGAVFTLYKGEEAVDTYTTGDNGRVVVEFKQGGHEDGTYKLVETKAPTGYEASTAEFTIVVDKEFNIVRLKQDKSAWEWVYDLIKSSENAEYKDGVLTVPNTPVKTKVVATKKWNDNDNKDGVRPESIELTLNGKAGNWSMTPQTVTVKPDKDGNWSYTWDKDIVGYHNGERIIYSVTEKKLDDYTTTYSEVTGKPDANGYAVTVTNSHQSEPEKEVYVGTSTTFIDGAEAQPGDTLTYKITYTNTSGSTATATVTDTIPAHTTYVNGSADNDGAFADGKVTWTLTNVPDGESKTVSFKVTVNDDVNGAVLKNTGIINVGDNEYSTNEVTTPTPSDPVKDVFDSKDPENSIDGDKVIAGQELLYKITYKNTTGKDVSATITDEIPANSTYVSGSADNKGVEKDGVVTWNVDVPKDGSITVSFKVTVNEDNGVSVDNDAVVQVGENKYNTNETTNPTGKEPEKEVYVGKSTTFIDGAEAQPGDTLTYKIKYENTTGAAVTATITDTIPAHTKYVAGSADNNGVEKDGVITWKIDVPKDGNVTVSFQVTVDEDVDGAELKNTSKVNDGANDYDSNEVTTPTPSDPVKDVFDSKDPENSIDGNKVIAGQELLYKITYKNTTGKTATATITDEIPANSTYVDGSADHDGSFADGKLTWTLADVKNGDEVTVSFKVTVNKNSGVSVDNDAVVQVGKNKYNTNETTNPTGKEPEKEVYVGKSTTFIDGAEAQPGDTLTYKIKYENTTGAAVTATITDTIPAHTKYVDGSADNNGVEKDGVITWKIDVPKDGNVTVSFQVTVDEDVNGAELKNTSKVNDGVNDYDSNEVTTPTPSDPVKDVFDSKDPENSIDGDKVIAGQELLYKITYKNTTGKTVTATIEDEIPANSTYVDGSADHDGSFADGKVTWTLADVKNGDEVTVSFKVKVNENSGVSVDNDAVVQVGENKYNTNETTNPTGKDPEKEVYVGKSTTFIDGAEAQPGDTLTYKIKYENTTGADVTATITDSIPAHTKYVDGSADNKGVEKDGVITWKIDVPKGESVTVSFQVTVDEDVNGALLKNKSKVNDGANDYDSNEVTTPTPSDPVKDVFKNGSTTSIDGKTVYADDELLYKVTYKNTTGKTVETATITDTIPNNTTYVDGSADNDGAFADGKITWTLKDVENGGEVTVSFKVKVTENNGEVVKNKATARVGENDYDTNETSNPVPSDPTKEVFTSKVTTNIDGKEVKIGEELTYKINYKNTTAEDVTAAITDSIPAHTEYVKDSADNGGTFADGKVTWSLPVKKGEEVTVSFKVKVKDDVNGDVLKNKAVVNDGVNDYETNETKNPTPRQLTIRKNLADYVDNGEAVKVTFAFEIKGKYADGSDYTNTIGMEFTKASDAEQTVVVKGIPNEVTGLTVEEVYTGNYKPAEVGAVKVEDKDGMYQVSFNNTKQTHNYEGGAVNHYAKNDGKYTYQKGTAENGTEH